MVLGHQLQKLEDVRKSFEGCWSASLRLQLRLLNGFGECGTSTKLTLVGSREQLALSYIDIGSCYPIALHKCN
jgi:hypothetical protein